MTTANVIQQKQNRKARRAGTGNRLLPTSNITIAIFEASLTHGKSPNPMALTVREGNNTTNLELMYILVSLLLICKL